MVISHDDSDHAGGAASLLAGIQVGQVYFGHDPPRAAQAAPCRRDHGWTWDGVTFTFLHPAAESDEAGNDGSCVLRVKAGPQVLLLTGDIEQRVEEELLVERPAALAATLLVVPHHGSASSSTAPFLDAVAPRLALFSSGYGNRFGHPDPGVIGRYRERGIALADTARVGAIEVRLGSHRETLQAVGQRRVGRHFWNAP